MKDLATILIVDDDENVVKILRIFLGNNGHTIHSAFNGVEALRIIKRNKPFPDLILMDHRMPCKNGIETTKEILSQNPNAKIVFLTGDCQIRQSALKIGVTLFLDKPFRLKELRDNLKEFLE